MPFEPHVSKERLKVIKNCIDFVVDFVFKEAEKKKTTMSTLLLNFFMNVMLLCRDIMDLAFITMKETVEKIEKKTKSEEKPDYIA